MTAVVRAGRRYMNVNAAAEYLGRTKDSLYALAQRRQIPHYRFEGRVFFRIDELDAWMNEHRIEVIG